MMSFTRLSMLAFSGLVAFLPVGVASVAAEPQPASSDAHNLSGQWWIEHYTPTLTPLDGSPVPYTVAGRAEAASNAAAIRAGKFEDPARTICLLPGLPRAMISAYPMKLVQHDRSITFIHEQTHAFWHAVIGGTRNPDPDSIDPAFMGGESIATWEGDTLVIDSRYFKSKSYLDDRGMPHGDDLHVVQRLSKIDGGKKLEALMTIEDPAIFTKPWTARRTYAWRPDVKIMEYVCGEPKRVLPASSTGKRVVPTRRKAS